MHHHGAGHANRCYLLAKYWPLERVHVFTSAVEKFADWEGGNVHVLPMDTELGRDPNKDLLKDQVLHYAPIDLPGLSKRMSTIAAWIAEYQPLLFIVDLSVEVALFVRLCGVRVALVRLHGKRDDPAHQAAFGIADYLLAPFPPELEDMHTSQWVRDKSLYLGAFSRYDDRKLDRSEAAYQIGFDDQRPLVVIINGSGGDRQDQDYWQAVAAENQDFVWWSVGLTDSRTTPLENYQDIGFVGDTFPHLRAATIVIGSGGTNTMMEIGAARARYISLPEARPFEEQYYKMKALERLGLTVVLSDRPAPQAFSPLLVKAQGINTEGWDALFAKDGLVEAIDQLRRKVRQSG